MKKTLVAYFSASGITKELSKRLSNILDSDLYEIKPKVPYTNADLDWSNSNSRSSAEMRDLSHRPELSDLDANVDKYDVIFIGFPIWWYIAPTIINTFLENYNFENKIVVFFATSGSSDFGDTILKLKPSLSNKTIIKDGRVLKNDIEKKELENWIDSLKLF